MRAVWSFWSKPFDAATGWGWHEPLHHRLAWGLSLRLARRHYPETVLITDSAGKASLVDDLGLSFTHVSTQLDCLQNEDPSLWALGKLVAYSMQDEPFVHLDTDVFLWRPLPARLTAAAVLAQHPERWSVDGPWSGPCIIEDAFARAGLSLPAEWEWARSHWGQLMYQANCGIVGGTNVAFLRHYAQLALDVVLNPLYATVWAGIAGKPELNMILEQFMLSACLEFHRSNPGSPYRGIQARYLFPSSEAAFNPSYANRMGFTHLIADSKRDANVARRLEERVAREDRDFYRHCLGLGESVSPGGQLR